MLTNSVGSFVRSTFSRERAPQKGGQHHVGPAHIVDVLALHVVDIQRAPLLLRTKHRQPPNRHNAGQLCKREADDEQQTDDGCVGGGRQQRRDEAERRRRQRRHRRGVALVDVKQRPQRRNQPDRNGENETRCARVNVGAKQTTKNLAYRRLLSGGVFM